MDGVTQDVRVLLRSRTRVAQRGHGLSLWPSIVLSREYHSEQTLFFDGTGKKATSNSQESHINTMLVSAMLCSLSAILIHHHMRLLLPPISLPPSPLGISPFLPTTNS
jgi:hypothetical protein